MSSPETTAPDTAKIRFTVALPDGLIYYQAVEFEVPTTGEKMMVALQPLSDWLTDRMDPWLEAA